MGYIALIDSTKRIYKVRVKNNCCVDIIVKWSIFLKDDEENSDTGSYYEITSNQSGTANAIDVNTDRQSKCSTVSSGFSISNRSSNTMNSKKPSLSDEKIFTLMLMDVIDNQPPDVRNQHFQLVLTQYYGQPDYFDIYTVKPVYLFIKAMSENELEIQLNPNAVQITQLPLSLNAVLVGQVYKARRNTRQYEWIQDNVDLVERSLININARIETSTLKLISMSDDLLYFEVSAVDILKQQGDCNKTFKMLFKNTGRCFIKFNLIVEYPYTISKILNINFERTYMRNVVSGILLQPDDSCQVTIEVHLYPNYLHSITSKYPLIQRIMFRAYEEGRLEPKLQRSFNDVKQLTIQQSGLPEKVLELKLKIKFPTLEMNVTKVMFSPVHVNTTSSQFFFISTNDSVPVYFKITEYLLPHYGSIGSTTSETSADDIFVFVPSSGYVLPQTPLQIMLYFTPGNPKDYKMKFIIETEVEDNYLFLSTVGTGTINKKYSSHHDESLDEL